MKKILTSLLALMAIGASVNAQSKDKEVASLQLGIGPSVSLPVGNLADVSSFGVGAEFQAELKVASKVSAIGSVGFTHFFGKDLGGGTKIKGGALPILVGARVYPSTTVFIGAQIGYTKLLEDFDSGGFAYKPQIGYDGGSFQLALSYNGVSQDGGSLGWLGLSGIIKF